MIDLAHSRIKIEDIRYRDLLPTQTIAETGLVMQDVSYQNMGYVRPSNAEESFFVGFSWADHHYGSASTVPFVDQGTVADGEIVLSQTAVGVADMLVLIGTTKFTPGDGVVAGTFSYDADSKTLTVPASNNNETYTVSYRYSPTVAAAKNMYGDGPGGLTNVHETGRIGLIRKSAELFIDNFDTSVNWADVSSVGDDVLRGGTNGRVTVGGTGCVLSGCRVLQVPTATLPLLGIELL